MEWAVASGWNVAVSVGRTRVRILLFRCLDDFIHSTSLFCSPSCISEYLVKDVGGYTGKNSLRTIIAEG